MSDPSSDAASIRYYCTAGNGMESFLIDEVKTKLAAENVHHMPGKVLFSSSARINKVTELKSAERLFLLLKQDSPVRIPAHISPAKAVSVLQSRLLADRNEWTSAVMTWSRLQMELSSKRNTSITSSPDLGVMRKREKERWSPEEKDKRGFEGIRADRKWEEEQPTLEKKRKRYDEEEEAEGATSHSNHGKNVEKDTASETSKRKEEEQMGKFIRFTGAISKVDFNGGSAPADHSMQSGSSTDDCVVQRVERVKTPGREEKTLSQSSSTEPEPSSCFPVSFRISCKCTGSLSRVFSAQEVGRVMGVGLGRLLGWEVDLKNPQLEINVYLTDDHCLLGIPLTKMPLANRSYIKTTGLRSTVAWAMTSLAQIQPGFCVVDPMCGTGTILIEAAQEHKTAFFLGVDIDDGQLQKAKTNVEYAELGNRIHLLKASSVVLPLPSASVDAVVCDLPFGKKFGTKANMAASLPLIVTEMERVLCIGGTLVLLLSPQLSCLLRKHLARGNTESMSNQKPDSQTGMKDRAPSPPSSTTLLTFQNQHGVKSSSTQEKDPHSELKHKVPPPVSSLRHEVTVRVSLGVIDGLIHKYVKVDA
ncbi:THUMP domain-containing protein 2 [Betta splendens]|uniref:THUMP domain-containing protein 2 n=1 Tax=Betta splendens TaxID=158456 RepID=A0A6P7KKQ8_BETSP|nr:THUMP domain-containing protein 2 [Betta splendens]